MADNQTRTRADLVAVRQLADELAGDDPRGDCFHQHVHGEPAPIARAARLLQMLADEVQHLRAQYGLREITWCGDCRALQQISHTEASCTLGYELRWSGIELGRFKPQEPCPKPRTLVQLRNEPQKLERGLR